MLFMSWASTTMLSMPRTTMLSLSRARTTMILWTMFSGGRSRPAGHRNPSKPNR